MDLLTSLLDFLAALLEFFKFSMTEVIGKKLPAIQGWLSNVMNIGRIGAIHIADDNNGEAQAVVEAFEKTASVPVAYSTGENKGVAKNKNRGIKWFLESPEASKCKYLLLSDDDIIFHTSEIGTKHIGDLLIKACENAQIQHVTGFLGGSFGKVNDDGTVSGMSDPFFTQFPAIGEDEYVIHCAGSQGVVLFYYRELLDKVGYFGEFPGKYGYEHSEHSARCARMEGKAPGLFSVLKHSNRYFHCQNIPNDYVAKPNENSKAYERKLIDTMNGVNLKVRNPGV